MTEEEKKENPDRRNIPPIVLIILLAFTFTIVIDNQADIGRSQDEIRNMAEQNRQNSIEGCERSNDSRVSRLENYRHDIGAYRSQIRLVKEFAGTESPVSRELIRKTQRNIQFKKETILEEIASIKSVALPNDSEVVDCELAYPLIKPAE